MTFDEWLARTGAHPDLSVVTAMRDSWAAALQYATRTEVAPTWDADFVAWLRKETPITFAAFCNQFEDERRRDEPQSSP